MQSKLKAARQRLGMSQIQLAELAGISRQALSAIETGKQDPSLRTASTISRALNQEIEDLFLGRTAPESSTKSHLLTKPERLTLVNQYEILKRLSSHKSESDAYERLSNIFRYGYESLYREAFDRLWLELPDEIAEDTLAILELHRALLWSLGDSPTAQDLERVKFVGFDGNYEASHLAFARFYTSDGESFQELKIINSHHSTLNRYRRMLAAWYEMDKPFDLTRKQIDEIIDVGLAKTR